MVCVQANKFSETRLCCKPKAEFRASLSQSGPKLTLGLVDGHANERGVNVRVQVLASRRACMNAMMPKDESSDHQNANTRRLLSKPIRSAYARLHEIWQNGTHCEFLQPSGTIVSQHLISQPVSV